MRGCTRHLALPLRAPGAAALHLQAWSLGNGCTMPCAACTPLKSKPLRMRASVRSLLVMGAVLLTSADLQSGAWRRPVATGLVTMHLKHAALQSVAMRWPSAIRCVNTAACFTATATARRRPAPRATAHQDGAASTAHVRVLRSFEPTQLCTWRLMQAPAQCATTCKPALPRWTR